jgi:hypothetical protein
VHDAIADAHEDDGDAIVDGQEEEEDEDARWARRMRRTTTTMKTRRETRQSRVRSVALCNIPNFKTKRK